MIDDAPARGRFIRWLYGHGDLPWGTRPERYDPEAVEKTLRTAYKVFGPGRYFDTHVAGFENVPGSPALIVSNHSGGTTIPDAWGFLVSWYRHFGVGRPIHPLAHEIILSTKLTGEFFEERGVLRGGPHVALKALRDFGNDVMVMPGGDLDTWRPWKDRYKVRFGGRTGYAKLALKAGVPIVPVANAGAHETLIVLTDGRRFAEMIGLHRFARASIFPVHLSLPWGLAVGPWPHIPPPKRLRYRVGKVIDVPRGLPPDEDPPHDLIHDLDATVQRAVQSLLDELKREAE